MMKYLFAYIALFICHCSFGQIIYGTVVDGQNTPIPFCQIRDTITDQSVESDLSGNFTFEFSKFCILEISHATYTPEFFAIEGTSDSSLVLNFQLNYRIQLIEGVTISSERMETVVDQRNINVIDYLPFDNALLVLKSHKGKRLLSIEGQDTTYRILEIGKLNPREIFLDCFENIHLLSSDSSYQILLDTAVRIVSRSSIREFDYAVRPCVADYEHSQVFGNFSNHNKKYTLTSIQDETRTKQHFLHIYDEVGEDVARSSYYEIISRYFLVTPEHQNMILDKVWSGNVMELQSLDSELDRMITWYVKMRGTELNIQSFQYNNLLFNIDQYSDSIRVYNELNQLIYSKPYSFYKSKRVNDVLLDRSTGAMYEQFIENGICSLREIALDKTITPNSLTLKEAPFCKNIRIHDDWVYFMVKENDFYQINRILLKEK